MIFAFMRPRGSGVERKRERAARAGSKLARIGADQRERRGPGREDCERRGLGGAR